MSDQVPEKVELIEALKAVDYHEYVPTFLPERIQLQLHDLIDEVDVYKIFRILMIIYVYLIVRRTYTNYIKKKQVEDQIRRDNIKAEREAIEGVSADSLEDEQKPVKDDGSWGWGKSTRRKVKKQEAIFEQKLKLVLLTTSYLDTEYNPDSDEDIADLLED